MVNRVVSTGASLMPEHWAVKLAVVPIWAFSVVNAETVFCRQSAVRVVDSCCATTWATAFPVNQEGPFPGAPDTILDGNRHTAAPVRGRWSNHDFAVKINLCIRLGDHKRQHNR
jgi:hypothetical protein